MIRLHGLDIDNRPGDKREAVPGADLRWIRRVGDVITPITETTARLEPRDDGAWTHHYFGNGEGTQVHFAISADGRLVESDAEPNVPEAAVLELLSEAVMRSVFRHRGLVSFHAAVLARDGRAIAIMGDTGAGKSTLSVALTLNGWRLVADDLVRLVPDNGRWLAQPGLTQSKVHDDVAAALGLPGERLARRWIPLGVRRIPKAVDKLIYAGDAHVGGAVPLGAIYMLAPRVPGIAAPHVVPIPAAERINQLLRNVSIDAALPKAKPGADAAALVLRIAGSVPVFGVTMPDDLSRLSANAAAFAEVA